MKSHKRGSKRQNAPAALASGGQGIALTPPAREGSTRGKAAPVQRKKPYYASTAQIDVTFKDHWRTLGYKESMIGEALKRTKKQVGPQADDYVPPPWRKKKKKNKDLTLDLSTVLIPIEFEPVQTPLQLPPIKSTGNPSIDKAFEDSGIKVKKSEFSVIVVEGGIKMPESRKKDLQRFALSSREAARRGDNKVRIFPVGKKSPLAPKTLSDQTNELIAGAHLKPVPVIDEKTKQSRMLSQDQFKIFKAALYKEHVAKFNAELAILDSIAHGWIQNLAQQHSKNKGFTEWMKGNLTTLGGAMSHALGGESLLAPVEVADDTRRDVMSCLKRILRAYSQKDCQIAVAAANNALLRGHRKMKKFEKAIYEGGQRSITAIKFTATAAITVATAGAASSLTAATLAEGGATLSAAEITTVKVTSELIAGGAAGATELATKGITAEALGDEEAKKELSGDAMGMAVGLGVGSTSIGLFSRYAPRIASKVMTTHGDAVMRAFPGMSRKAAQKELEAYIIVKGPSFLKGVTVNTSKGVIEGKDAKEIGLIALEEIGSTAFDLGKAGSGLEPIGKTEMPKDIYGKTVKERFKLTPERFKEAGKGFKEEVKTKVKDELKGKVKE